MIQARRIASIVSKAFAPILLFITLVAWGISSPINSSPDDTFHSASIWCAGGIEPNRCEKTIATLKPLLDQAPYNETESRLVVGALSTVGPCFGQKPEQSAICQTITNDLREVNWGNWNQLYPPIFYKVMSFFIVSDFTDSILFMRTINAALFVLIISALVFLLPRKLRAIPIWTAVATSVPFGMFIIPSINPSSWAVIAATGLVPATVGYLLSNGWRTYALGTLIIMLQLMGCARGDMAIFGIGATILGIILALPNKPQKLKLILLAVSAAISIGIFLSTGQKAMIIGDVNMSSHAPLAKSTLAFINLKNLPDLWTDIFGVHRGLGWLDTNMPGTVWATGVAVYSFLILNGLRKGGSIKKFAVFLTFAALIAVSMYMLQKQGSVSNSIIQSRYLYPLLIILATVSVFGFSGFKIGLSKLQIATIAIGITIANSVALHVNIRRYVTGTDVPNFNLDAGREWWWGGIGNLITPMTVWTTGTITFALTIVALLWLVWNSRQIALSNKQALTASELNSQSRPISHQKIQTSYLPNR